MACEPFPYYYRNWDSTIPSFFLHEGIRSQALHITELVLPFIGTLYQPAGRYISAASSLLNLLHCVTSPEATPVPLGNFSITVGGLDKEQRIYEAGKAALELCTLSYGLKQSLIVHTSINMFETVNDVWSWRRYGWKTSLLRAMPLLSNALYLATFFTQSKKIVGVSLAFRAGQSIFKAYYGVDWKNITILDTTAYLALAGVFAAKAFLVQRNTASSNC